MGAWQQARSAFEFVEAFSFEEILELEGLVGVCAGAGLSRRTLCGSAALYRQEVSIMQDAELPGQREAVRLMLEYNPNDVLGSRAWGRAAEWNGPPPAPAPRARSSTGAVTERVEWMGCHGQPVASAELDCGAEQPRPRR